MSAQKKWACPCAVRLASLEKRFARLAEKVQLGDYVEVCVCGHDHWTHACQSPMHWKCSACKCQGWKPDEKENHRRLKLLNDPIR
jgi:hypothetical protein